MCVIRDGISDLIKSSTLWEDITKKLSASSQTISQAAGELRVIKAMNRIWKST